MAKKQIKKEKVKEPKRLFRSEKNKVFAGVCGGIAEYFNIDPVIARLMLVLLFFAYGSGIFAYLIAWIIIPLKK